LSKALVVGSPILEHPGKDNIPESEKGNGKESRKAGRPKLAAL
jgi:hypothetical protein